MESSSLCRSFQDSIMPTPGYDFQEGQYDMRPWHLLPYGHTMRGRKARTSTASPQSSADSTASRKKEPGSMGEPRQHGF